MTKEITSAQAMRHPTVVATINVLSETTQRLQDEIDELKKPWVGLTDAEITAIVGPWGSTPIKGYTRELFDKIEAKLKEKNFDQR